MEGFQSVPRTVVTTTNVLKVENTFDHEWDVIIPLDKGQIASRVGDFGQVDGPAVLYFIRLNPQLVLSGADGRPSEAGLLAFVKIRPAFQSRS